MEFWLVMASSVDLITFVDCFCSFAFGKLQDFKSFFGTKGARTGSEGFYNCKWVAFPDHFTFEVDKISRSLVPGMGSGSILVAEELHTSS